MGTLKQKLVLSPNILETKKPTFFGLGKLKIVASEDVYKVEKAVNFRAKKYYYPKEVDELMEMGVEVEIR